jgi:hypothetical protein
LPTVAGCASCAVSVDASRSEVLYFFFMEPIELSLEIDGHSFHLLHRECGKLSRLVKIGLKAKRG